MSAVSAREQLLTADHFVRIRFQQAAQQSFTGTGGIAGYGIKCTGRSQAGI
ncbi:hypothetical protein M703_01940 [Neisseria gonorrhoeae SK29344]|nr:hypothetical protein M678_02960 [Neisseria gonorrhoeae SK7461]KLR92929.1 hypothetical protein M685_02315 [Neisseria gonorrhoeae SK16259]KLS08449.1 hypothetical protein M703_01940 [Neisseria gonorrhoeae SK29344]KLS08729.1 hypothetical protein M716_04505 [Neisseria gonorrhoeae SK32402]KLS26566.1 hypothetical protein M733_02385 [Neisseria gonorrhoeae ATL_2011_05-13]KLS36708.1 hypothetical protein M724_06320 [Neisseria gonorrhoeae ATL_2011_01_05]KLS43451.1 hypothetical protein M720_06755 [Neis